MDTTTALSIEDVFGHLERDIEGAPRLSTAQKATLKRALHKAQLLQRCSGLKPSPDMSEKLLRHLAGQLTEVCLIIMEGDGWDVNLPLRLWPMGWRLSPAQPPEAIAEDARG